MAVNESFRSFVLDQLSRVATRVRSRSMFGGVGIYSGDLFFALIDGDTLYLKVDDSNRGDFEARGLGPFRPFGDTGETMQYYQVDEGILEDVNELRPWVDKSVGVARAKRVGKSTAKKAVAKKSAAKKNTPAETPHVIEQARDLIARAGRLVVLTGAGISAESGVPTFRGSGGLWKSYRAEDLATPEAFRRDARLVWEWYGWRRDVVRACSPNAAHAALARYAASHSQSLIATQNVDGLHRAAGTPEASLVELHGALFRVRCTVCAWRSEHTAAIDATSSETLPKCVQCGALARPDIVWFGEALEPANIERAFAEASAADVCLVVGTSGVVQPAASMAAVTQHAGGAVIEVNPAETPITSIATVSIRGTAVETVPAILVER